MGAYFLRKRWIRAVRARREARARRRLQAREPLWSRLRDYLAQTSSTGCQLADYDALYRYVRRHRPREVLECGTGVSTLVIASALQDNARDLGVRGRVTSMEDVERWYRMAEALLPSALRDVVDLRLSPKVEDGHAIFRGVRYAHVPDRPYDFVFVDGPGTSAPSDGTRSFDFDYLYLLRRTDHPVSALVDQRLTTVYVLQKLLGPRRVRYRPTEGLTYVAPSTRSDLRAITRSSGRALTPSIRLLRPSVFHLRPEPPPRRRPQDAGAAAPPAAAPAVDGTRPLWSPRG